MAGDNLTTNCITDEELASHCFDNDDGPEVAAARETILGHVAECAACRELWLASAATVPLRPSHIGGFELRNWLGNGSMGDVFVAFDTALQREIALKILRNDDAEIDRVLHEARAMAKVVHPNVVTVYAVGSEQGQPFIAMEFVRGTTALAWQQAEPRRWQHIVAMYVQFGRGLHAAHQSGIVHCDFKPSNALITDDGVGKVSDFGMAKARDTPTTYVQGTKAYMAPELLRGEPATFASDQYAFAVALWEALWRQRPTNQTLDQLTNLPSQGVPDVVRRVVVRALQRSPGQRYSDLAALLRAIEHAALTPQRRKRRNQIVAAMVVTTLGIGAGGYALHRSDDSPPACRDAELRLDGTWDQDVRTAIYKSVMQGSSINRNEIAQRLVAKLDTYSAHWVSLRTRTCEATRIHHVQSEALLDHKMQCLDDHLLDLRALTQIFVSGRNYAANDQQFTALINRSIEASQNLPSVESCAAITGESVASLAPADRERIASIRALASAGLYQPAQQQSAAALATTIDVFTRAELQFIHAEASEELGQYGAVVTEYQTAARDAARAGADELRARIWLAYAYFVGHLQAKNSEGLQLLSVADEAILRAKDPPALRAQWLNYRGTALLDGGDVTDALVVFEQAQMSAREAFDSADVRLAPYYNNYGAALRVAGKLEAAAEQLQRAVTLRKHALGDHHVDVATSLLSLGNLRFAQGDSTAALQLQNEALEIRTSVFGPKHVEIATTLIAIGAAHRSLGQLDQAAEAYSQAIAIWTTALGADHPNVALALNNIGAVKTQQRHFAEARRALDQSLSLRLQKFGNAHIAVASTRQNLGELELAEGHASAAIDQFNHVLRIRQAALGSNHSDLSYPLWGRGSAELMIGQRVAARNDLERASAIAVGDPSHRANIAAALAQIKGAP
jgi:eukaryotic-like serine/threonine-protein kinase